MRLYCLFCCILLINFPSILMADTGPLGFGQAGFASDMETDRPDFTEGPATIDKGHLQLETGFTYTKDIYDTQDLPELLIRGGLTDSMELRIYWEGYVFDSNDGNGTSDMSLGIKQFISEEKGIFPEFSFILESGIPSGSQNQSPDGMEPALILIGSFDLGCNREISANLSFASRSGEIERYFETASSLSYSMELTENLGGYLEYYGIYPSGGAKGEFDEHYLNSGLTYAITKNIQTDIRIGLGLNSDSADMFTGAGLSWRI